MLIPKAEWILLNNPRDEVGGIFQQYSLSLRKMIVVIIKHCAYFVLIAVITRVKMCEELVYFIQSATETWYLSLEKCSNKLSSCCSSQLRFLPTRLSLPLKYWQTWGNQFEISAPAPRARRFLQDMTQSSIGCASCSSYASPCSPVENKINFYSVNLIMVTYYKNVMRKASSQYLLWRICISRISTHLHGAPVSNQTLLR